MNQNKICLETFSVENPTLNLTENHQKVSEMKHANGQNLPIMHSFHALYAKNT